MSISHAHIVFPEDTITWPLLRESWLQEVDHVTFMRKEVVAKNPRLALSNLRPITKGEEVKK